METCLKHHFAYPNVTAGATRGSVRNHACAIVPTVLLRALIIKAQPCRRAHIISNDNSFIHDVPRGHAQQGWRHGGVGTETCHGEEIHTCLPLPIDRRGDARFGTKSRVCNSTDGASSCIDYQSTIMPTGAHNFKRKLVHTRRAPRGCSQPGEEAGGRRGSVSALLGAAPPCRPPPPQADYAPAGHVVYEHVVV